ncbi:MAG: type II secretion system protein GspJ [Myxococcota bacterium]
MSRFSNRRRARRGMTLAEVMVATVVLLVMAMIIAESLRNSVIFDQELSTRDQTIRTARVVMSKLKRDLQLAYLTPQDNGANLDRYRTVFVGFNDEPDKLFFASLNHQRMYLDTRESDQTEITVWCEPSNEGDGYTLFHREGPRIDEEPDEQGTIWPLAYNVRSFSVRYLDQQDAEWKDEWDTRASDTPYRLPRAVEIALVLIAPDPEDEDDTIDVPFVTQVMLEWAPRLPAENPGGLGAGGNGLASRLGQAAAQNNGGTNIFNSVQFGKGGYAGSGRQGLAIQAGQGPFAGAQTQRGGRGGNARNQPRQPPAGFGPGGRPPVQMPQGQPLGGTVGGR